MQHETESIKHLLEFLGVAAFGGVTRYVIALKWRSLAHFAAGITIALFVAGFSGLMMYHLAIANNIDPRWHCILAGMSGYVGSKFLEALEKKFLAAMSQGENK